VHPCRLVAYGIDKLERFTGILLIAGHLVNKGQVVRRIGGSEKVVLELVGCLEPCVFLSHRSGCLDRCGKQAVCLGKHFRHEVAAFGIALYPLFESVFLVFGKIKIRMLHILSDSLCDILRCHICKDRQTSCEKKYDKNSVSDTSHNASLSEL